ncbi:MAG: hypothetical protein WBE37_00120 [Bryobacteraceae bacterium]
MEDEEKILTLPAARPEFMNLSEADAWKAIADDPWQCNLISGEVTRLVVQCMGTFKAHFGQDGYVPRILRIETRCPIERVAVLLVVKFVQDEGGDACEVTVH